MISALLLASATLAAVPILGTQPAAASEATVKVTGSQWLAGGGVPACAPSTADHCGGQMHVGGVSGNWWQCVELAQRLYQAKGWYGGIFSGVSYAYQIYDNAAALGMSRQAQGSITSIVPGDMIVHTSADGGGAGHVSVVNSISGSTISVVEQNFNNSAGFGTYSWNISAHTLARGTMHVYGVVHDPDNTTSSPPPSPPPSVNLSGAVYDGRGTLSAGETLQKNHYLTSADGRYVLFMQNDGNLVQYGPGLAALWWTGTSTGQYVAMQNDGNLVMYQSDGVTAVWSTNTSGTNGAYIAVQRDGNIVMYESDGATTVWAKGATGSPWTATSVGSQVNIGQTLPANRFVQSPDGRFRLFLHPDGNLILYSPGYHVTWANWKNGTNGAYVAMQSDSNFVEYLSNGATAVWSSATSGSGGAYVAVQNDGNVVMYQSNGVTAVWSTHTGGVF